MRICWYAASRLFRDPGRDAFLQEQPPQRGAALTGRSHRAEQHGTDHQIGIGVIHHDDAVVAAEFEQTPPHASTR